MKIKNDLFLIFIFIIIVMTSLNNQILRTLGPDTNWTDFWNVYLNIIENLINKNNYIEIDLGYLLGLFKLTSVYTQDMNICFNELLNKIIYYINDNNNLLFENDNKIFEYILSKFTSKHVDIGFLSEDIFNIDVNKINLLNQSPIFKYIKNTYKLREEIFNKFDGNLLNHLYICIAKNDKGSNIVMKKIHDGTLELDTILWLRLLSNSDNKVVDMIINNWITLENPNGIIPPENANNYINNNWMINLFKNTNDRLLNFIIHLLETSQLNLEYLNIPNLIKNPNPLAFYILNNYTNYNNINLYLSAKDAFESAETLEALTQSHNDDYLRLAIDILKTDNTAIKFKEIFIPALAKNNNKISVDYVISYLHFPISNDEFKSEIYEELAMNNNDSAVNYMISYLNSNKNQKVFEIFASNSSQQAVNFISVSLRGDYFSSKYKITQVFWEYLASNDNNDAVNYLIKNIDKIEFTDKFKNNIILNENNNIIDYIISFISTGTLDITADIFKNMNPKIFNFLISRDFKLSNSDDVNTLANNPNIFVEDSDDFINKLNKLISLIKNINSI